MQTCPLAGQRRMGWESKLIKLLSTISMFAKLDRRKGLHFKQQPGLRLCGEQVTLPFNHKPFQLWCLDWHFRQSNLHQFTLLTAGQLVHRGPDIFYFENLKIYWFCFFIWPANTSLPPTESILSWDWALCLISCFAKHFQMIIGRLLLEKISRKPKIGNESMKASILMIYKIIVIIRVNQLLFKSIFITFWQGHNRLSIANTKCIFVP